MIYSVFFLIGVLLGVYAPGNQTLLILTVFIVLFFLFKRHILWRLLLVNLLGFLWVWWNGYPLINNPVKPIVLNQKIQLTGTIANLVRLDANKTQFIFKSQQPFKAKLKLSWYHHSNDKPALNIGQQWQFYAKLKRNNGFHNTNGFDYETWLFSKGFMATGYVINQKPHQLLAQTNQYLLNQTRAYIKSRLLPRLQSLNNAGVIYALVSGNRQLIKPQQFERFINTNTSHLTVVSGLHIGLVSGFIFILSLWGFKRCHRCCLKIPAPVLASIIGLITALVYALIAGFSIATERAFIMASIVFLSVIFKRHLNPWHLYAIALVLVLIRQPLSVLEVGFWLSFGAVAIILYGINCYAHQNKFQQFIKIQILISIAMIPILLWLFSGVSLLSIPANLIAVPLVSVIILPLSLLGAIFALIHLDFIAIPIFQLVNFVLEYLSYYLEFLQNIPFSFWHWHINFVDFIALILAMTMLFLPKGLRLRWLGLLALSIILLSQINPNQTTLKPGEIKLTTFDIGQGLSVLVQTHNQNLLFDTGFANALFSTAKAVVVPFLKANYIQQLDYLIISHGDNDHSGGIKALQPFLRQTNIITSTSGKNIMQNIITNACQSGQTWQNNGVKFSILNPTNKPYKKDNNNSCVLKIEGEKYSILLTGDIEKKAEKYLIKTYGNQLKSTVLIVPHHGSKTSSSLLFLKTVSPIIAINSSGFKNRFKHPHPTVKKHYLDNKIAFYDTQCSGQISLILTSTITIKQSRPSDKRYWIRQCEEL